MTVKYPCLYPEMQDDGCVSFTVQRDAEIGGITLHERSDNAFQALLDCLYDDCGVRFDSDGLATWKKELTDDAEQHS